MSDVFKKLAVGELKNVFSSGLATAATAAAGYGTPEGEITRGGGILSQLMRRGMPPRPPEPPPELYRPVRTDELVNFGGTGSAQRLMEDSASKYDDSSKLFAIAVSRFADATEQSQGSANRMAEGADDFGGVFDKASQATGVDQGLLRAIAQTESSMRPGARSPKGAMGLMQLMPGTAKMLGVTNALDPYQNVMGGAEYMQQLLSQYGGSVPSALAAYNMGPAAYSRATAKGIPLPAETQAYVQQVQALAGGGTFTPMGPSSSFAVAPGGGSFGGAASAIRKLFPQNWFSTPALGPGGTAGFAAGPVFDDSMTNAPAGLGVSPGGESLARAATGGRSSFASLISSVFGGSPSGRGGLGTVDANLGAYGPALSGSGLSIVQRLKALSTGPAAGTAAGPALGGLGIMAATQGIFGNMRGTAGGVIAATGGGFLAAGPIGAAIGAGISLGEMAAGVESPRNQVLRLGRQIYHINISNGVADQIVLMASQSYGGNIAVAMRSPEVSRMLGLYAAGTGQGSRFMQNTEQPHGASLVESGGRLFQQATYEYGQAYTQSSALPVYGGVPSNVVGPPGGNVPGGGAPTYALSLNIGGQDAAKFMTGQVVSPDVVQTQYAAAMNNSTGRVPQALMMSAPGAIVS
jgi:hypothetical protein